MNTLKIEYLSKPKWRITDASRHTGTVLIQLLLSLRHLELRYAERVALTGLFAVLPVQNELLSSAVS